MRTGQGAVSPARGRTHRPRCRKTRAHLRAGAMYHVTASGTITAHVSICTGIAICIRRCTGSMVAPATTSNCSSMPLEHTDSQTLYPCGIKCPHPVLLPSSHSMHLQTAQQLYGMIPIKVAPSCSSLARSAHADRRHKEVCAQAHVPNERSCSSYSATSSAATSSTASRNPRYCTQRQRQRPNIDTHRDTYTHARTLRKWKQARLRCRLLRRTRRTRHKGTCIGLRLPGVLVLGYAWYPIWRIPHE